MQIKLFLNLSFKFDTQKSLKFAPKEDSQEFCWNEPLLEATIVSSVWCLNCFSIAFYSPLSLNLTVVWKGQLSNEVEERKTSEQIRFFLERL